MVPVYYSKNHITLKQIIQSHGYREPAVISSLEIILDHSIDTSLFTR